MFKNVDISVLDDSTGLKLLNYLTKDDGPVPRSRKRLFRVQSTDPTLDDFSVRQVRDKENTLRVRAESPKRSTIPSLQERSSLFKPNGASTPMVPTTTHTPYRTTKKSIGVQRTPSPPLPALPLSQQPEVPETPEVVVPQPTPAAKQAPVILENVVVTAEEVPARIYPDLENVVQQQDALPATPVATRKSVARLTMGKEVDAATEVAPQPAIVSSPPPPPASQPIPPAPDARGSQTPLRGSIRVVSPERLMEIIHSASRNQEEEQLIQNPRKIMTGPILQSECRADPVLQSEAISQSVVIDDEEVIPATQETALKSPPPPPPPETPGQTQRQMQFDDSSFFVAVPTPVMKNFKLVVEDCRMNPPARRQTRRVSSISRVEQQEDEQLQDTQNFVTPKPVGKKKKIHRASELTIPSESRHSSIMVAPSTYKRKLHSIVRELTPISSPVTTEARDRSVQELEQTNGNAPGTPISSKSQKSSRDKEVSVFKKPEDPREKKKKSTAGPKSKKKKQVEVEDTEEEVEERHQARGGTHASSASSSSETESAGSQSSQSPNKKTKKKAGRPKKSQIIPAAVVEAVMNMSLQSIDTENGESEQPQSTTKSTSSKSTKPRDDDTVFKKPMLPAPKKKRATTTKAATASKEKDSGTESFDDTSSTRRSNRTVKPVAEIMPYYLLNDMETPQTTKINYNPTFADFCHGVKVTEKAKKKAAAVVAKKATATATVKKSTLPAKIASSILKDVGNAIRDEPVRAKSSTSTSGGGKRVKDTTKVSEVVEDKKRSRTTKKMSIDEMFDTLKETPSTMPVIAEEEGSQESAMQVESVSQVETPKARTKSREDKRRHVSKTTRDPYSSKTVSGGNSTTSRSLSTYRENFSGNLPPSCSTGVDSFASQCQSSVIISRTMEMDSFVDLAQEKVRRQNFNGGLMMTYPDYSKGIIVLHDKKDRARVKRKPLTLNVVSGTVIVNLESEQRAVRLTELDEISIPVNMWYSIEKISEANAMLMFTWK